MKVTYQYATGAHVAGVDAETAGHELKRLQRSGPMTAERLVAKASAEDSPLHPAFEWDDAAAAEEYRLTQARHLMRSVRVIVAGGEPIPLLVHVTHAKLGGSAYVLRDVVLSDSDLREAALEEARRYLAGALRRFRDLEELAPVWEAIERVAV